MPALPLVLLLTLTAGPDRGIPPGCREDHRTCREDCTIDYGGGTAKYKQLNQCVSSCDQEQDACTTRFYTLRNTVGDQPASAIPSEDPEQFADPQKDSTVQDTERRDVYRAQDAEESSPAAPPPPEPEEAPAPPPPPPPEEEESPVELLPLSATPGFESESKPAPDSKKKAAPSRPRGKQEEMRIFGDSDDEAGSKRDAAGD